MGQCEDNCLQMCMWRGGEDGGLSMSMKTDANSSGVRAFFKEDHLSGETQKKIWIG